MCNSADLDEVLGKMADIRYRTLLAGQSNREVADRILEVFPAPVSNNGRQDAVEKAKEIFFARHGLPLTDHTDPGQYGFDF